MTTCTINGKTFQPIEYKVLVLPDQIDETDDVRRSAKAAGIVMVESDKDREQMKQVWGTLIAAGGKAFADFGSPYPEGGARVCFAKFAGLIITADDGSEFRLMNDKDVTGILL
jgi:co-chaperonin GroES (HSP10)